ncbi:MAG: glycosyltransferase family 2 protein [Terriglobia bacterium]
MEDSTISLSIVIPVFNEAQNIQPLTERLSEALATIARPAELIFVDDGSSDGTMAELRRAQQSDPRIRILRFRSNLGQTAALEAGFHHSRGDAIVTLDGDLQNDPAEIPALLAKLDDWDVVCGVRVRRQDSWLKRISSRMANGFRNWATDDDIIDTGCTLKAYRADRIRTLKLYKGMHRFLPTLLKMRGCRVLQVPVGHYPRRAGQTKYGTWGRLVKGLQDLYAVRWMKKNWIDYSGALEIYDSASKDREPGAEL